ncbi:MAG TPA: hypothetical protein VK498_09625 [Ferruginibacter sp.]|nr:hypothetical protein [Ferruginibacter sp.]
MKNFIIVIFLFSNNVFAQELFVYTEPASNMAAKSIGIRLNNTFMRLNNTRHYEYYFIPEVMVGVSKKIMIHGEGFFSNGTKEFKAEGGALYFKYRFYSRDEVHSHFRMAGFAKGALNNSHIHQPAIDLNGHNSGYEAGLIATKLMNKGAVSASTSFLHATDNLNNRKFFFGENNRNAVAYSLSAGMLLLPKEYNSYEQTNLNLMLEILGQSNPASATSYVDLAPSLQLIIYSRMRLDLGYRFAVLNELGRTAETGWLLRFEYNMYNVF